MPPVMKLYQVDAFASEVFTGNPAAVVPLDAPIDDALMQKIAMENNLSETAFVHPEGCGFRIRWFTPKQEVDLCGHATLAAAHVHFHHLGHPDPTITFASNSGPLRVKRLGNGYEMDFPAVDATPMDDPAIEIAVGRKPLEVYDSMDALAFFEHEDEIRAMAPDLAKVAALNTRALGVTAPGTDVDFVSRLFAPQVGVNEDPVTGSLHCMLAPIWAKKLGKTTLTARQLSPRGGEMVCTVDHDRVRLGGNAFTYMTADLTFLHA